MSSRFLAFCAGSCAALACSGTVATADSSSDDTGADVASQCPAATGPAGFHGSCASVDPHVTTCQDYTGLLWGVTATDLNCLSNGGKFSATDHCATAGLTGKCLLSCGQPDEVLAYVYFGNEATSGVACETEAGGKWFGK